MKWILYCILALIWGSSFMLMMVGLQSLSPFQVASLRIMSAGLVLIPFSWRAFHRINSSRFGLILLSGLLGSFFPAFLFCMAEGENKLDSSFAGMLNSLTPLFVILVGVLFFRLRIKRNQVLGILIAFIGSILLFFAKSGKMGDLQYVGYVILATMMYGTNVNLVTRYLGNMNSRDVVSIAFTLMIIPCFVLLYSTGFFEMAVLGKPLVVRSILAAVFLGISSTALASVLFYILMQNEGPIFASTITFAIPIVVIMIGTYFGEVNTVWVVMCLLIMLIGILAANWDKIRTIRPSNRIV